MAYTTYELTTLFHVAPQTIRNWTREFACYLSMAANPKSGRTRLYDEQDLQVLVLVDTMRTNRASYQTIHTALASEARGAAPGVLPEELQARAAGETMRSLALEAEMLRQQLASAEGRFQEMEALRERAIWLDVAKEAEVSRQNEISVRLKESEEKLERLLPEVGCAYHKGYLDALKANSAYSE